MPEETLDLPYSKRIILKLQEYYLLTFKGLIGIFQKPLYIHDTLNLINLAGPGTTGVVILIMIFAGMALTLQLYSQTVVLGFEAQIGRLITLSVVKEIAPITIALIFAGKVGAGITTEVASMIQRHEIDTLRAFSVNPVLKIVTPRYIACLITLPGLTFIGDLSALLGGYYITSIENHIPSMTYWISVRSVLGLDNTLVGIVKPFIFGFIISSVSCHMGFNAKGGSIELKTASTRAYVISAMYVMVSDFIITRILSFI